MLVEWIFGGVRRETGAEAIQVILGDISGVADSRISFNLGILQLYQAIIWNIEFVRVMLCMDGPFFLFCFVSSHPAPLRVVYSQAMCLVM